MSEISMNNCSEKWGSVRKVRYLSDISSSVKFALEYADQRFSAEVFRKYIFMGRQLRLGLIHKHYQSARYTPMGRASLATRRLKITLPDTLTFLRNLGIFEVKEEKVHPLPLGLRLSRISNTEEANLSIIKELLDCKYLAYWCFLRLLSTKGLIEIPRELSGRGKSLGQLLRTKGVYTDVPSFYTIRDLFYELEAANWYVDSEGNELIYPTIALDGEKINVSSWQYSFSARSSSIFYRRIVSMDSFLDTLVNCYLNLSNGRFDVERNLMYLRDDVCKKLKISDQHFKKLIRRAQKSSKRVEIRLSFGLLYERKRNYALKIVTLPEVSLDRLALYVRIRRR